MICLMSLAMSVRPRVRWRLSDSGSTALYNLPEVEQLLKVTCHIPQRMRGSFLYHDGRKAPQESKGSWSPPRHQQAPKDARGAPRGPTGLPNLGKGSEKCPIFTSLVSAFLSAQLRSFWP